MTVAIVLVWLAVSTYALVGLFRPIRPFGSRRAALFSLLGAFIISTIVLAIMGPKPPMPKTRAEPPPPQQNSASGAATSGSDPFTVVRLEPGEHAAEAPHADPKAVATYRGVVRDRLKYLSQVEGMIGLAVDRQRPELAQQASLQASKTGFALTNARGPLTGTAELEFAMHCERAAYELGRLADKVAAAGIDYEAFQDRASLFASYTSERKDCERWVTL